MECIEAVKEVARRSGVGINGVGPAMGRSPSYLSVKGTKGTSPRSDTLALMLGVCGWSLVAVPRGSEPADGIVIDPS